MNHYTVTGQLFQRSKQRLGLWGRMLVLVLYQASACVPERVMVEGELDDLYIAPENGAMIWRSEETSHVDKVPANTGQAGSGILVRGTLNSTGLGML